MIAVINLGPLQLSIPPILALIRPHYIIIKIKLQEEHDFFHVVG